MLVNDRSEAGDHEVKFSGKGASASGGDGSTLARGVYIDRLNAGSYAASRTMLLLK
jgi:hypothetical protein